MSDKPSDLLGKLNEILTQLDGRQRAYWMGCALGRSWRNLHTETEEGSMEREEMVYLGGKRTQEACVDIRVHKEAGNNRFEQVIEASSTAAAMDALEALIRGYEQFLGVPAHHVLAVLSTVMTVPVGRNREGERE